MWEERKMKIAGMLITLAVLVACETTEPPRPAPEPEPRQSGVSVSGYGRVGVSTTF